MGNIQLAKILFNMSLDMDYADYVDTAETEVKAIEQELQALEDTEMPYLRSVLEQIAMDNLDMENWLENQTSK